MALVICPKCDSRISDQAHTCPYCGKHITRPPRPRPRGTADHSKKSPDLNYKAGRILRGAFDREWAWRLYVVLTIIGLVGVVVLDLGHRGHWDLWPDFFRASYWRFGREFYNLSNWLVMLFIFGPFLIAKALDWIASGQSNEN